jgi:hypothetical protein
MGTAFDHVCIGTALANMHRHTIDEGKERTPDRHGRILVVLSMENALVAAK